MINLDPIPPLPNMNTAAVNFLDLLADPKAARKLMDDIKAAHDKATAAIEEAKKLQAEVVKNLRKLEQSTAAFETDKAAHKEFLATQGKALDGREQELNERASNLTDAQAAHAKAVADHEAEKLGLRTGISALDAKVRAHEAQIISLATDREHVNKWLAWLNKRPEN